MQVNESVKHSVEELKEFKTIWDQYGYRKTAILNFLEKHNTSLVQFDAIACRGGNVRPIPGGVYRICEKMIQDMKSGVYGGHPTNVGGLVAFDLGKQFNIPVFTLDPPMTDELCASARYSGIPQIERMSSFHALNQKATARKISAQIGSPYENLNMIVAIWEEESPVGAHRRGEDHRRKQRPRWRRPLFSGARRLSSRRRFREDVLQRQIHQGGNPRLLTGGGGLVAYLGTTNAVEIEQRIAGGDKKAGEVFEAMAYQAAKEVGACAAVLEGKVDAIALTGSLVYSKVLMASLRKKISFIAPIYLNPGENEMLALAEGVMRLFNKEEPLSVYH